jgi:tetratricopeptide (TPR) repeat protein
MKKILMFVSIFSTVTTISAQTNLEKATSFYQQSKAAFKADYTSQEEFVAGMQLADSLIDESLRRGMTRNILKMRAEANYDLNKAIQLDPEYGEAYFHLGYWYYGGALDAEACSHWTKAKELGYDQADGVLANYCGG